MTINKLRVVLALVLATAGLPLGRAAEANSKGYIYQHEEVPDVPWSIQVLKIERNNPNFELHSMLANGSRIGLNSLSDQIAMLPRELGKPIAAINGDYYAAKPPYLGDPKGVQISRGELISAPFDWTCVWFDSNSVPTMGIVTSQFSVTWPDGKTTPIGLNELREPAKAVLYTRAVGPSTFTTDGMEIVLEQSRQDKWLPLKAGEEFTASVAEVRQAGNTPTSDKTVVLSIGPKLTRSIPKPKKGDTIKLHMETSPSLKDVPTAISGGPALVRDAEIVVGWSAIRHPRAAIGWNKEYIFFVQVDGRQPGHSVGMTYSELATYMQKLGCQEALNLDGGGSATFWMLGQIMNSPSKGHSRDIANGLVLVQKNQTKEAATASEPKE